MLSDKQPESVEADPTLLQRVNSVLQQRGYGLHHTLDISVERGVVVVQGTLPTFYMRQIAVECIKRVAGVTQVIDQITVVNGHTHPQTIDSPMDEQESSTESTQHRADHGGKCEIRVAAQFTSSPPSFVRKAITLKVLNP